jgi:hypothetical protein
MTETAAPPTEEVLVDDAPPREEPAEDPAEEAETPEAEATPEAPAPAAPATSLVATARELKLVASLRPLPDGGYRAQLAVGANDCDPELRVQQVDDVAGALHALGELSVAAHARWEQQKRYPAVPKPTPAPRQPAARTRAASRPAAGTAPAGAPPAPPPAQPTPSVRMQRQVGPDGKVKLVKAPAAPPANQPSLFGDSAPTPAPAQTGQA